ncbi:MAG: glucose 1-dehydrogenase [Clostridia bacterium]|nr:glucose 1-dehydrogenase [Clostridia bacterium]
MLRVEGKTAIVTGGASGIGRAIVLELAREGADVVIADIQEEAARQVAGEVAATGRRALPYRTDVTSSANVREMVAAALREFGKIDILVNVAGWDKVEPFVQSTEETWDKVIAINLKGPIICARAVLDHMIERRYGKICSIASDAGRVGSSGEAVYSGAKGGVIAFSKTLAREMARYGINVNVVCPGPTDTPLFRDIASYQPKIAGALEKAIPMGRLGKPEDLAPAVVFLVSDQAGYITGQTLSVSGGLTMC